LRVITVTSAVLGFFDEPAEATVGRSSVAARTSSSNLGREVMAPTLPRELLSVRMGLVRTAAP
jgi:hypothetical protein